MLSTTIRMNNNNNQEDTINRKIMDSNREIMVVKISTKVTKINTTNNKMSSIKNNMITKIREAIKTMVKTRDTITKVITMIMVKDITKVIRKPIIRVKDKITTTITMIKFKMINNVITSTRMIIRHKNHTIINKVMRMFITTTKTKITTNIMEDKIVSNTTRIMIISIRIMINISLIRKIIRMLHP